LDAGLHRLKKVGLIAGFRSGFVLYRLLDGGIGGVLFKTRGRRGHIGSQRGGEAKPEGKEKEWSSGFHGDG
jgi:hypothetical protein